VLLCAKRTSDLVRYISDQETSGEDIRTMQVLKVEGDLHGLADTQRNDRPTNPQDAALQDATVRYFELGRDIIKAIREGRPDDANRLQEESEGIDAFVHQST